MNISRLDLPIAPATDALGTAIDAATTSAGAIAETAAALSDQVATHVAHAVGETSRRLSLRHLVVGAAVVGTIVAAIVFGRRRRGTSEPQVRDAGAVSRN
jgi:hypothetical protein